MKKKTIIESQVSSGIISPELYKQVLENQVRHDMVLAKYFKEAGDKQRLQTVVDRVKLMKKELTEIDEAGEED